MMGITPREAADLDFWTYQALMWNWNQEHDPERKAEPVTPAMAERLQRAMAAHSVH